MPELPEVEFARRLLQKHVVGKAIKSLRPEVLDEIVFEGCAGEFAQALSGRRIVAAHRKGKNLWLEADRPPHPTFHLGMTGSFQVRYQQGIKYINGQAPSDEVWPPKFSKLQLEMDDGTQASFADPRRFGRIRLADDPCAEPPISELGFDALDELPPPDQFDRALQDRGKMVIKAVLLDQAFSAGIGNWIADEVLYHSSIHPARGVSTLSSDERRSIRDSIGFVLRTAVDCNADSDLYPQDWLFRHRWSKSAKGKVFTSAGHLVEYIKAAGRTTAVVPELQRLQPGEARKRDAGGTETKRSARGNATKRDAGDTETKQDAGGTETKQDAGGTETKRSARGTATKRDAGGTKKTAEVGMGAGDGEPQNRRTTRRSTRLAAQAGGDVMDEPPAAAAPSRTPRRPRGASTGKSGPQDAEEDDEVGRTELAGSSGRDGEVGQPSDVDAETGGDEEEQPKEPGEEVAVMASGSPEDGTTSDEQPLAVEGALAVNRRRRSEQATGRGDGRRPKRTQTGARAPTDKRRKAMTPEEEQHLMTRRADRLFELLGASKETGLLNAEQLRRAAGDAGEVLTPGQAQDMITIFDTSGTSCLSRDDLDTVIKHAGI